NHERARLMATMVEVGLCGIGPDDELPRTVVPDEFAADEIRAALVLTRRAADAQFWLAHDLLTRLPAVHAAMDAGVLDEPRARVLSEWTTGLDPQAARAVCTELLPRASRLTTGQLIEQIKKLAIALDPDWARRRYEQALAERKVLGYRNADGSANLSGVNLPVDRVAAASGHIDALAKAAKRAGDLRPIDHIRADLFLGMTDGTYTGLDDTAILDHLRSTRENENEPDDESHGSADEDSGPDIGDRPDCGDGPEDRGGAAEDGRAADESAQRSPVGAGLELRVRLSTLLGRDQYPAELAGWGPVHAELARDLTSTLGGAQWRFAITDERGQLSYCGITRARPTDTPTRISACRAIVELAVPLATLRALAEQPTEQPTELGAWAPVVTDLLDQLARGMADQDRDTHRRSPGTALGRYLEARDRSCIMIGCRAPARTADKDHTRDHGHGGPTTGDNLGAACRHHHRLKHQGGWRLHQPQPGHFHWTSRLGHSYHRPPPPILEPLPDPLTPDRPPMPLLLPIDAHWESSEIWAQPPEPKSEPPPRSEPHFSEDIPPF
ncbi:MAG: DUF222 domain-containing protein, partial [Pseudonocardiales bacterium]|nr:DUF222 domain-containing protein [Pseudonocardiales bacterium]